MAPSAEKIASVLERGRNEMAGLFTDTVRITKTAPPADEQSPLGDFNETTGQYDNVPEPLLVYEGPGRMQVKADINSNVVETTAGDREWTYLTGQMQLPTITPAGALGSVDDVDVDNVVNWLASRFAPSLVGRQFNVAGPYHKSQAVYLRFRIKEAVA